MEPYEFEGKLKKILRKASEVSGMSLEWLVVSCDPDCISDFGCDYEGFFTIEGESFPLKLEDMTMVRYRWNDKIDGSDSFIRFEFGREICIDYCFDNYTDDRFHVQYFGKSDIFLNRNQAIKLMTQWIHKDSTERDIVVPT